MEATNYGVLITGGAAPWQIFQQNENGTADITVFGTFNCVQLSQTLPLNFTAVEAKTAIVKARIAHESTSESVIAWQLCTIDDENTWTTCFKNVPAGGLYRIETYMEYEGWNGLSVTRGDMIHNIGVGDVFVIAGQSNAAGRAKSPVEDAPELGVHVLRPSGRWDLATNPLGETTAAIHTGHYENHNPGHTPYLHFAKRLHRELGYPIGLVTCAYGGSPLRWWNPDENGALFTNMLEMLADYALHPRAVLWYQGEAEGYENSAETYLARFHAFVRHTRAALQLPNLPFITVQLNRCVNEQNETLDVQWGLVREAQRRAMDEIEAVYTVPAIDVALYDFIHNAPEGNLVIGERCARVALSELYGRHCEWRAPQVRCVQRAAQNKLVLHFSMVQNWLNPFDVPPQWLPFDAQDKQGIIHPMAYTTGQDTLTLEFDRPILSNAVLHGAWRMNPGSYVPCDCMRMPMLSFYGLRIPDAITE